MEQLTKKQAVAPAKEAVQNQQEPHRWDEYVHSEYPVPFFFFQAEDGIRDYKVTGVQTCALPISPSTGTSSSAWRSILNGRASCTTRPCPPSTSSPPSSARCAGQSSARCISHGRSRESWDGGRGRKDGWPRRCRPCHEDRLASGA